MAASALTFPVARSRFVGSRSYLEPLRCDWGQVGAAGENAAMESFFALLQKNVLDRKIWNTRKELRLAIVSWIEGIYHRKRHQRALGKLTPIEFMTIMEPVATLAA